MVIDASVAFKWLVEEDDSALAIGLLGHEDLLAPGLILAEVGNALWKRILRGEMNDPVGAAEMLGRLPEMLRLAADADLASAYKARSPACHLSAAAALRRLYFPICWMVTTRSGILPAE